MGDLITKMNYLFIGFTGQDNKRIVERNRDRSNKQGVKTIVLAAPWISEFKQRACFNIW